MDTNIIEQDQDQEQESTLASALQGEFKSAPWYVSSLAIHALVFLLLMLMPVSEPVKHQRQTIITAVVPEETEPLSEPVNDIEERDPVLEDNTNDNSNEQSPIIVTSDFEISDHTETDDNMEDNTAKGDPDSVTTFDGEVTGTPALIGVGNQGGQGGGGRFGSRVGGGKQNLIARNKGSKKTEDAVTWALKWLAEHQEADGHWDNKKYGGGNHAAGDVGISSLAILAFLGAGNSAKFGQYKNVVQKATYWLVSQENPPNSGCFGPHKYEAGIALMALAEAYGMGDTSLKAPAQRAVDWAIKSQCPAGGWNYIPNSPRVDTSVTGWWIMGLKSAKVAGLTIPYEGFEKALKYVQKATKVTQDGGYGTSSVSYATENAPAVDQVQSGGGSERMTAVSLTCLQFLGMKREDPQCVADLNQIIKDGLPEQANYDFYRWYYATLGVFQMGVKSESWQKWNEALKPALLNSQVKEGTFKDNKGSWNYEPDGWGASWGRVGQTALGALMLEIYYRYDDVHRNKK